MEDKYFKREDAYKTLDTINMWINNCDTKASIIISIIGVAASIIFSSDIAKVIKHTVEKMFITKSAWSILLSVLFVLSIIICTMGIYQLFKTISPTIINEKNNEGIKNQKRGTSSIMFYAAIASTGFEDYKKRVKAKCSKNDTDDILNDLLFQIHSASIICTMKFNRFKNGLHCFFGGFVVSVIILLIAYYNI